MKIGGLQPQDVYKSYIGSTSRSEDPAGGKKSVDNPDISTDRVEISSECADLNEARELVRLSGINEESGDRSAKLEALKSQIEAGEYYVSADDIARRILNGKRADNIA